MGNSLIFTAASSQYLSATGNTSINQQKFTIAFWFQRSSTGGMYLYGASDGTTLNHFEIFIGDYISILSDTANATKLRLKTTATYIDNIFHHLCIAVDTTQPTAANRAILYVDGVSPSLVTATYPLQNTNLSNNYATPYSIGSGSSFGLTGYFNGNLAEFYYIDGQQLPPSSFISGTPGFPVSYTGTYAGMFDFYLNFSNGTSITTLGADSSGEGNNWTLNNMTTTNQSSSFPVYFGAASFIGAGFLSASSRVFIPVLSVNQLVYIPPGATNINNLTAPVYIGNTLDIIFCSGTTIVNAANNLQMLLTKPSGQQVAIGYPLCYVGNLDMPLRFANVLTVPAYTYCVGQILGLEIDQSGVWSVSLTDGKNSLSQSVTFFVNPT